MFFLGIIAIAWLYVAVMMAAAEATSAQGTLLGAFFTLVLYGVLPLGVLLYIMATPLRRKARLEREQAESSGAVDAADPDAGGHAAGDAIAPERKEP